MGLTPFQLQQHQKFITGSKVQSILGLPDAYMSKFVLFACMTGQVPWPQVEGERIEAGNYMEDAIAKWCADKYGWNLVDGPQDGKFHPQHDFLYGIVDRLLIQDGQPTAVVEIKNVDGLRRSEWEEGPPDKFRAQVYFYSQIYNLPGYIVTCFGGNHLECYEVPRNPAVENFILSECSQFWKDLQENNWPQPDGSEGCSDALAKIFDRHNDGMVQGSDDVRIFAAEYSRLSGEIKALEEQKGACGNKLKEVIANRAGVAFADGSKATWKMTKPKKEKFDEDRFAEAHPDLHKSFLYLPEGCRRLDVRMKGEVQ